MQNPKKLIGCYAHYRVPLKFCINKKELPYLTNYGMNLKEKLIYLSSFEYIITNTYHGLYWGTLLNRKVIVMSFKSGLLSFKYKPVYCFDLKEMNDEIFHNAKNYEEALEESRKLNIDYYVYLTNKYEII